MRLWRAPDGLGDAWAVGNGGRRLGIWAREGDVIAGSHGVTVVEACGVLVSHPLPQGCAGVWTYIT